MDDDIELISDGEGIAVIGDNAAVERYLSANGLESRPLDLSRIRPVMQSSGIALDAGAQVAQHSGRWIKLTEESAKIMKGSQMMKGSHAGVSRAIATSGGKTKHVLQFAKGSGALLTNPAILAGVGGIMAQYAMQQTMNEILDYLATIDQKVDDILRAQDDAVLADMIGVDFVIDEALTIRDHVGNVSDVTWSKVQATSLVIARTQAYSLRQLDAIAEKLERTTDVGDLSDAAKAAAVKVPQWLAVLARCLQLQEATSILELDRVLESAPADLDRHRVALKAARDKRLALVGTTTEQLLARIDHAATHANTKVLVHPIQARAVVDSGNQAASGVLEIRSVLGLASEREALAARRWREAASDTKDRALDASVAGLGAAKDFSGDALEATKGFSSDALARAKSATGTLSGGVAERARKLRRGDDKGNDAPE